MKNLFDISGKVALVTGGSRGIGEMIAAGFLANGAKVYISSRKAQACDATAARLSETYGGTCVSLPANLSNVEGCAQLAGEIAARESQLDILIKMQVCLGERLSMTSLNRVGTRSWTRMSKGCFF